MDILLKSVPNKELSKAMSVAGGEGDRPKSVPKNGLVAALDAESAKESFNQFHTQFDR